MNEEIKLNKVCDAECSTDNISPKWILRVKSSIRPIVTYSWHIFTIVLVSAYLLGKIGNTDKDVVMEVLYIELFIIVFWFGERTARNIGIVDLFKSLSKKGENNAKI